MTIRNRVAQKLHPPVWRGRVLCRELPPFRKGKPKRAWGTL